MSRKSDLRWAKIELDNLMRHKIDIESNIAFQQAKIEEYTKHIDELEYRLDMNESKRKIQKLESELDDLDAKVAMATEASAKATEEFEAYKEKLERDIAEIALAREASEAAAAECAAADAEAADAEAAVPLSRTVSIGPLMPLGSSPLSPLRMPASPAPELRRSSRIFSPMSYVSPKPVKRSIVPPSEFVAPPAKRFRK